MTLARFKVTQGGRSRKAHIRVKGAERPREAGGGGTRSRHPMPSATPSAISDATGIHRSPSAALFSLLMPLSVVLNVMPLPGAAGARAVSAGLQAALSGANL